MTVAVLCKWCPDPADVEVLPDERFDAIVVGAGPAGSAAAYKMARAGLSVVLVERGAEPGPNAPGCAR